MTQKYLIITAGGAGVRMNSSLPKQFLLLAGKPVIMHTLEAFIRVLPQAKLVLVLPETQMQYWKEICQKYAFRHEVYMVAGGPTRFHSVKNGLKQVPDNALVGIHDGVRPLVSDQTILQTFDIAARFGNAIPVVPVNESVRIAEGAYSKTADRSKVKLVQTPQCFQSTRIREAYQVNYNEKFTDDASVLEHLGDRIFLVEGNRENIKITTPEDLCVAEALISFLKPAQPL